MEPHRVYLKLGTLQGHPIHTDTHLVPVSIHDDGLSGQRILNIAELVDALDDLVRHTFRLFLGVWNIEMDR